MTLPLATTSISVVRSNQDGTKDVRTTLTWSVLKAGIRAHISTPSGTETVDGGSRADVVYRLDADPCDLTHADRVLDEDTSITYEVVWAAKRRGLGLDHTVADLRVVTDRVST